MIELYYYSGTGFTLKAARILEHELNEEVKLIPIINTMNKGITKSSAKKIGLLMPMHAFSLPLPYLQFLKTFTFQDANYIFSLVTRGGAPTRIHREIDRLLRKQGKKLNAFAYATTPNTFETIYDIHNGKIDEDVEEGKKLFESDILSFAELVNRNTSEIRLGYRSRFMEYILFPLMKKVSRITGYFKLSESFYADNTCTGCGQCEKTCLSGKIHLMDNCPVWQTEVKCQYCLACLHLCPQEAIQVTKTNSPNLGRIHHPEVTWKDIWAQKKD